MEMAALQADSKFVIDDNASYVEQGIITARMMDPVAFSRGRVKDNKLGTVCKADLISLANEEEVRKSEALIDNFLKGEIITDLFPTYR